MADKEEQDTNPQETVIEEAVEQEQAPTAAEDHSTAEQEASNEDMSWLEDMLDEPSSADTEVKDTSPEPTAEQVVEESTPTQEAPKAPVESKEAVEETPTPEQASQGEEQPAEAQKTEEELRQEFAARREEALSVIAQQYALSDDEADGILSDPKVYVPKLAAKLHVDVYEAAMRAVYAQIPSLIDSVVSQRQNQQSIVDKFFEGDNAVLKDHMQDVLQVAKTHRQMNPTMPADQFMEEVSTYVKMMKGLMPQQGRQQKPPAPQRPYRPAAAGSVSNPPSVDRADNEYTALAREFIETEEL